MKVGGLADSGVVNGWVPLLQECPTIQYPADRKLYHGARRLPGQDQIQQVMFFTEIKARAESYMAKVDAELTMSRSMLEFVTFRDLQLLDMTGISGPTLSSIAQQELGTSVAGICDIPLKTYLIDTVRKLHGQHIDGCLMSRGDEIILDDVLKKLRRIK